MSIRKRKYSCLECRKKYHNESELEAHGWYHNGYPKRRDGPYKCPYTACPFSEMNAGNKGFKSTRLLATHVEKCQHESISPSKEEEQDMIRDFSASTQECREVNGDTHENLGTNLQGDAGYDADPSDESENSETFSETRCSSLISLSDTEYSSTEEDVFSESCASAVVAVGDVQKVNPYPVINAESVVKGPLKFRSSRLWMASWKAKWNIPRTAMDEFAKGVNEGKLTLESPASGRTLDRCIDKVYAKGVVCLMFCE